MLGNEDAVMRNKKWICLLLSVITLLGGCGSVERKVPAESGMQNGNGLGATSGSMEAEGFYDLELSEKKLDSPIQQEETFLGAQYFEGERIWFIGNEDGQVFCYYEESGERELLLEEVQASRRSADCRWYRDAERFYVLNRISLLVLHTDGKTAYETRMEETLENICISKEGNLVFVTSDSSHYGYVLKTMNPKTGVLSGDYALSECFGIAEGVEQGVLVIDLSGAYDLNTESGEKIWHMRWSGTSYSPNINNNFFYTFKITKEGDMELLQGKALKEEFYAAKITRINPEEMEKIPLVFRVTYANSGLKLLVAGFNQENQEHHVFLQERGSEDYGDFVARTDMEIAAGKGPDMFEDGVVSDIYALAAKGALENLEPYFAQSTIDRNEYYPAAFQDFGKEEGIYGIGYEMCSDTMYIREELTGGSGQINLSSLLDNMEGYEGQMIFSSQYYSSEALLQYFFEMSEDFYGMVDWEQKTCNFSGELWEKILQVSKKYGMTEGNREWEEAAYPVSARGFAGFAGQDTQAVQRGMVMVGYPAGNGMVSRQRLSDVVMNANSVHKEGVWQFIQFLLENQELVLSDHMLPVQEKVLLESVEADSREDYSMLVQGERIEVVISQGMTDRFWECLNYAQPAPYRTRQILQIVQEEAETYFTGDKTIEEISAVIENRVRLYLAETEKP